MVPVSASVTGFFLHHLLQRERVVERGIDSAHIGAKRIAEADAEDVAPGDDADELVAVHDRDVMHAMLADEGADFGDRIAVVDGDRRCGS
jgi:hypothetical protein